MTPFGLNSWGKRGRRTKNQNSEVSTRLINNLLTRNNTPCGVRSVVSELQTSLRNVFARYTTLVCLVHAFKQHIKIPYPYRTFSKSAHRTSVQHFLAKIESYRTVLAYRNVPYCHAWSELLQNVRHLLHQ